jgi:hypothetical protein
MPPVACGVGHQTTYKDDITLIDVSETAADPVGSTLRKVTQQGRLLTLLNRREISARRGLIVSRPRTTGKSTALKQLGRRPCPTFRRRGIEVVVGSR